MKCIMKKTFFLSFFLLFVSLAFAQESVTIENANELYSQGEYIQAAHMYEQIIQEQGVSPELYYNLGNAYYKANEIGHSILNYERALRLSPNFEDAKFNLQLAQEKVVDKIKEEDTFFIKRWILDIGEALTSNQWLFLSCTLFVVSLIGFLFFVFGSSKKLRKTSFAISIALLIISVISLTYSIHRKKQFTNHKQAIVMTGTITVTSSPDKSGTELFELHEGTKVTIKSQLGEWNEIVIGDGRRGWIQKQQIEQI